MQQSVKGSTVEPGASLVHSCGMELKFDHLYQTDRRLRAGSYGTVYTCHHKLHPETTYAVKILDRKKLKQRDADAVFREVEIMKELSNVPTVVRLIDFFVHPETFYVVQVFAAGGDVFDRLSKRCTYTEEDARDLAENLLETIQALHSIKPYPIVHRDVKPENLLLLNDCDESSILLADFGFARHVIEENLCTTRCGTPAYVAPEVLLGIPYSTKCDLWSIGCLLYMLIGGYHPFQGANHRELFRKVRAADFVFHEMYWKNVSVEAKRLISSLLCVNPELRLDADAALQCDWFQKSDAESLRSNDLSCSLSELRKFRPRRTWKSTVQALRFAATAPFWNHDETSFAQQLKHWDKEDAKIEETENIATRIGEQTGGTKQSTAQHAHTIMGTLPKTPFNDKYELKHKLRKGSFATVWRCEQKKTKETFAVKIILRQGLDPKYDETILNEVSIMQSLVGNKYVVQIVDFFEEPDYFYIVMEHMAGGDVFDRIVEMSRYTEKDARDLVEILLKAVYSIHKMGIAHRDIKPQNLLLVSTDDNAAVKLGDFGFARRAHIPESLTHRVGTPSYVAPEILKNIPHDTRVDLWSIGVVAFVLLVGYLPFTGDDQLDLFRKIRNGTWEFNKGDWEHVSQAARDFIRGLLVVNPKERWSIDQCLGSDWIGLDPETLSSVNLSDSQRAIQEKKNRLRTLARVIMWVGKDSKPTEEVATQAQIAASETRSVV